MTSEEITKHLDEILTHLTSDAIWKILEAIAAIAVGNQVRRATTTTNSKVFWLLFAVALLGLFSWSAYHTHHRKGFVSGALFATDCFLFLLLAVAVVYSFTWKLLPPALRRLDWAKTPNIWTSYVETGGKVEIIPHRNSSLRFGTHFSGVQDKWASMEAELPVVQNFREWAGISFGIRSNKIYAGSTITLEVTTSSGSKYISGKPVSIKNQSALFLFQEMHWADWTPGSFHGYLDLQQVAKVAVVCYTTFDDVEFSVSNFALVKFTDVTF